ncbi:hypothetical protein ACET3Z_030126 [Daucus carota]
MGRKREEGGLWRVGFLRLWILASSIPASRSANPEVLALVEIKEKLQDPHGVLGKWDSTLSDPCTWTFVTCSSDSLVIGLVSSSQGLSGTLSPSIANLTNLQTLLLHNNRMSGKLPSELGELTKLQTLDLSNNLYSGEIPFSIAELKSLHHLRLNNNSLSGTIPLSMANMTNLTFLDLSYNNLSGPVPKFLAKTVNIMGNPMICATGKEKGCNEKKPVTLYSDNQQGSQSFGRSKSQKIALAIGSSLGCICLLLVIFGFLLWRRQRNN